MAHVGTIKLRRKGGRVILTVLTRNLVSGLERRPGFGVRSVHFGTKLRGYDIRKGQGYGWDGHDYVRAKRTRGGWQMAVPVRDNDPDGKKRRFVKGNCYIRTRHNEIIYLDLRKWACDPRSAIMSDSHGGRIIEIDLGRIPAA